MKISVSVDGREIYSDRTFKLVDAMRLLEIAVEEGNIPEGKITSVTIVAENLNQINKEDVRVN